MTTEKENSPGVGSTGVTIGKNFNRTVSTPFPLPEQLGEATVSMIQKGKREIVRVNLFRMQFNDLLRICVFAQLKNGTVVLIKRGFALAIRYVPAFRRALHLTESEIIRRGEGGGA